MNRIAPLTILFTGGALGILYFWYKYRKQASNEISDSVSALCVGRFHSLSPFFADLMLTDLANLSEMEILECVPKNKRPLATIFYKTVLEKHLAVRYSIEDHNVGVVSVNGGLVFSADQVCSSRVMNPSGRLHINEIYENCKDKCKAAKWIRMSRCNFFDEDLKDVSELVANMPDCRMIDLSWNRFHGVAPALKTILDDSIVSICKFTHVDYLDLTYNSFATIDRADFFDDVTRCNDEKLIWIPRDFLEENNGVSPGWYNIIKDEKRRETVVATHKKYYKKLWE